MKYLVTTTMRIILLAAFFMISFRGYSQSIAFNGHHSSTDNILLVHLNVEFAILDDINVTEEMLQMIDFESYEGIRLEDESVVVNDPSSGLTILFYSKVQAEANRISSKTLIPVLFDN